MQFWIKFGVNLNHNHGPWLGRGHGIDNFSRKPLPWGNHWVVTTTSRNAALLANYLPLRILPHPMTLPTVSVSLFHHNIVDSSPAHQWFREQVNTHAQPKIA